MSRRAIDLTNQTFDQWTVTGGYEIRGRVTYWFCRCACGTEAWVPAVSLRGKISGGCNKCKTQRTMNREFCVMCKKPNDSGKGTLCIACGEKKNAARKAYTARVRGKVLACYGGQCACCGEVEPAFLAIDHVQNNGAQERHLNQVQICVKILREGCPDTYQILCWNCNWGKYVNGGICPHLQKRDDLVY